MQPEAELKNRTALSRDVLVSFSNNRVKFDFSMQLIADDKMTEENYNYHTSPFLLRNQFGGLGKLKIPVIPKAVFTDEELRERRYKAVLSPDFSMYLEMKPV